MLLEKNFGKRLTLPSWKRKHRVRRLKNSLSLKVPGRRFSGKREKSCWQAWGMSVKASLAAWNSGASKSLHKKFFEDFQKKLLTERWQKSMFTNAAKNGGSEKLFFWFIDKWRASGNRTLRFWFLPSRNLCTDLNWRVWFWLRLNAGGVLNTCKSNAKVASATSRVAHGWVTRG